MSNQKVSESGGFRRREVLVLASEAAAASVLVACGGTTQGSDLGAGADLGASADLGAGSDLAGLCGGTVADGAEMLAPGQVMSFPNTTDRNRSFFVVRDSRGFYALRNVCTHNGCNTDFNSATSAFECPCHGSRYNFDGTVKNGPAPLPLGSYPICRNGAGKLAVDTSSPSADPSLRVK